MDTSAWIALHEPRDGHHQAARETLAKLGATRALLVTGRHTLLEFVDGVQNRYDQLNAIEAAHLVLHASRVRVEPSEPVWDEAMDLFERMSDWNVDLSDCLSFALMRSLNIRRAFAFDRDYEKAGFELL